MDTGNTRRKNSILDYENGFNVIVNFYIIRYLYQHLKKAIEIKNMDFYKDIMGMSRQRFQRICRGERFEISKEHREWLCEQFGIGQEYLMKNGATIKILDLDTEHWKRFFLHKYEIPFKIKLSEKERAEGVTAEVACERYYEEVEAALVKVTSGQYIANNIHSQDPVYRLNYYFYYGDAYKELSKMKAMQELLKDIQNDDWLELAGTEKNLDKLEDIYFNMHKHVRYIEALLIVKNRIK